jgi:hypothetical protein
MFWLEHEATFLPIIQLDCHEFRCQAGIVGQLPPICYPLSQLIVHLRPAIEVFSGIFRRCPEVDAQPIGPALQVFITMLDAVCGFEAVTPLYQFPGNGVVP